MYWANFFHIYQPPRWPKKIIQTVAHQSYRPLLSILEHHPRVKVTLNVAGSLTQQLHELQMNDIITRIKRLVSKGQIELVGSALYHPILPLITGEEMLRQIQLNNQINKKYFGSAYRPSGFFPPEMAISNKLISVIAREKFHWVIADEIAATKHLGQLDFNVAYGTKGVKLELVMRNRPVSDYCFYHSKLDSTDDFWHHVAIDGRSGFALITAMDGENLGHHRPGLETFWTKLVTNKSVTTVTVSELIKKYRTRRTITPHSSSWSSQEDELSAGNPYVLWDDPENPIHRQQWQLLHQTIDLLRSSQKHKNYAAARKLLDERLASDQFWWASAKPWWSVEIIKQQTALLYDVVLLLNGHDQHLRRAYDRINELVTEWQSSGYFKKVADAYLKKNEQNNVRFMGGKKITSH